MAVGMRAELSILPSGGCRLLEVGERRDIDGVARATSADGETVLEFVAGGPVDGAEKIFQYGDESVYRLRADAHGDCVCRGVETLGFPVREHRVRDGRVLLTFFVPGVDAIQTVVEELSSRGASVSVRRLTRSGDADDRELVLVDRGELTARQREVLERAHELGYFEHPKGANAGEVARDLGISTATFTEHLSAAQRKLLDAILD